MSTTLRDVRILIADDQADVARTLCEPLRSSGAVVRQVTDGEQALAELQDGGYDLLLLDMKMPPGDWGGLWVLEQLNARGWRIPSVVLSGEGGQRQTIQAMRLGAVDWIDKADAFSELEQRCTHVLQQSRGGAVMALASTTVSPLAHAFGRYQTAGDPRRRVSEGIRVLEETVRFAALIGLATLDPQTSGPLRGISLEQLARPSLGSWNAILTALVPPSEPGSPYAALRNTVIPDKGSRKRLHDLIKLRNDIAHGGHEAQLAERLALDEFLIGLAHRIHSGWPWHIEMISSMDFDGSTFTVQTLRFAGLGHPQSSVLRATVPPKTSTLVLAGPDGSATALAPWFQHEADAVVLFDGVRLPRRGSFEPGSPLLYSEPISRQRGIEVLGKDAVLSQIATWVKSSP
ncbi:response regulator transcription factor [Micromonospora chersina]